MLPKFSIILLVLLGIQSCVTGTDSISPPLNQAPKNEIESKATEESTKQPYLSCSVKVIPSQDFPAGAINCEVVGNRFSHSTPLFWRVENHVDQQKFIKVSTPKSDKTKSTITFEAGSIAETIALMKDAIIGLRVGVREGPPVLAQSVSKILNIDADSSSEAEVLRIELVKGYRYHLDKPTRDYKNFNRTGVDIMNSYLAELQLLRYGSLRWCLNIEFFKDEVIMFKEPSMGVHENNFKIVSNVEIEAEKLRSKANCDGNLIQRGPVNVEQKGFTDYTVFPQQVLTHEYMHHNRKLKSMALSIQVENKNDHWLMCQTTFTTTILVDEEEKKGPITMVPKGSPIFLTSPKDKIRSQRRMTTILEEFKHLDSGQEFLPEKSLASIYCVPCKERDKTNCFSVFENASLASDTN